MAARQSRPPKANYQGGISEQELRARYSNAELIKLNSNENAVGPSGGTCDAVSENVLSINRYPPAGDDQLRLALAEHWDCGLTPENFVTGNGAADVLSLIARWQLKRGTNCIISRPTFPLYEMLARREGARVLFVDLEPYEFSYNPETVLAAVSSRTRVIFICSPNNPTGSVCPDRVLRRLLESLPDHVMVVLDEVYHHFAASPRTSFAVLESHANLVLIHSLSKAHGLAGARLGYAIARPEIAREISRYRLPFHINSLTLAAGMAALRDREYVRACVASVREQRSILERELRQIGLSVWPSEANALLFKPPVAAEAVSQRLIERGVIVRSLEGFYLPGFLRVTVGTPQENKRFLASLKAAINDLEAEC